MSPTRINKKSELQRFEEGKGHLVIRSQSPTVHIESITKVMANDNKFNRSKLIGQCFKGEKNIDENNNTGGSNSESSVAAVLLSLQGNSKKLSKQEHNNVNSPLQEHDSKYPIGQSNDLTPGPYQSDIHGKGLRLASISSEEDASEAGSYSLALSPSDDEKPTQSYISLIANAILSTTEKRLVLSEIYAYVLKKYPYFRNKGPGWRNSIRHNLSLNECFVKAGRSPNGKGHFWAINPANFDDFSKGDFRRRRAQRRARKAMLLQYHHPLAHNGLQVQGSNINTTLPSPPLSFRPIPSMDRSWYQPYNRGTRYPMSAPYLSQSACNSIEKVSPVGQSHNERIPRIDTPKKKSFDMESLLKKDNHTSAVQQNKSDVPVVSRYYGEPETRYSPRSPSIYPATGSHHNTSRFNPYCNASCCRTRDTTPLIRDENDIYNLKMKSSLYKATVPRTISVNPSAESLAQAAAIARFERFGLPMMSGPLPASYCRPLRR